MRIFRHGICGLIFAVLLCIAEKAHAQFDDPAGGFLMVGLPLLDGIVVMGSVTAAVVGTIDLTNGRSSAGTSAVNYGFGSANLVSVVGYGITMGAVRELWPLLLFPCLFHAGLAISNFVIGYRVSLHGRATDSILGQRDHVPRVTIAPLASVERGGGIFAGIGLTLIHD